MSTRCQIGIYENDTRLNKPEVLLYRHSDGYPDGVLPEMMPFLRWFKKGRGMDVEYLGARLLQWLCNKYDGYGIANNFSPEIYDAGMTGVLGYGICKELHGDIEFYYAVYPDKVDVYECGWDASFNDFKLIKTLAIESWLSEEEVEEINSL